MNYSVCVQFLCFLLVFCLFVLFFLSTDWGFSDHHIFPTAQTVSCLLHNRLPGEYFLREKVEKNNLILKCGPLHSLKCSPGQVPLPWDPLRSYKAGTQEPQLA